MEGNIKCCRVAASASIPRFPLSRALHWGVGEGGNGNRSRIGREGTGKAQGSCAGRDTERAIQLGGPQANTWAQTQFHLSKWGNVDLMDCAFRIKVNNTCTGLHLAGVS